MCVSFPVTDCVLETVPEDEAYELQFGRAFDEMVGGRVALHDALLPAWCWAWAGCQCEWTLLALPHGRALLHQHVWPPADPSPAAHPLPPTPAGH